MHPRGRRSAANWLALAMGLLLLAAIVAGGLAVRRRPKGGIPKIVVGANDEVYYSRAVTVQQAAALGSALQRTGFFAGQGHSVMLSKSGGVTAVSFVLNDNAWDHAGTVAGIEEIGRRIAPSIGGFPIQIHLVDAKWGVRKSLSVGRIVFGARDEIYYLGSAGPADAQALGRALRDAGYLRDLGSSVTVSKDGALAIGFVVNEGVWDRQDAVAAFERLTRQVAPSLGGLPLNLRLLDEAMETKKELPVR